MNPLFYLPRKLLIAAVLIIATNNCTRQSATETFSAETDAIYTKEADAFIASGATKGQTAQTEAIRKAIAGDSEALNNIRNGRSKTDYTDERVTKRLYSSIAYLYTIRGGEKEKICASLSSWWRMVFRKHKKLFTILY